MKKCALCPNEHQRRGIYCSESCSKRVRNAKARGIEPRLPAPPFDCAWCGRHCEGGKASRFCSKRCLKLWHYHDGVHPAPRPPKAIPPPTVKQLRACEHCTSPFACWSNSKQRYCSPICVELARHARQGPRIWTAGSCATCGRSFVSIGVVGKYCHARCAPTRKLPRAKRMRIFARDGYRCHLCGELTLAEYVDTLGTPTPHPRAPTVDHLVPVSQGGSDADDNLACACFLCNALRQDTPLAA